MGNVIPFSEKIADLKQSDDLLKEYVRIRYQTSGSDRILALANWAKKADALMSLRGHGPEKYSEAELKTV